MKAIAIKDLAELFLVHKGLFKDNIYERSEFMELTNLCEDPRILVLKDFGFCKLIKEDRSGSLFIIDELGEFG